MPRLLQALSSEQCWCWGVCRRVSFTLCVGHAGVRAGNNTCVHLLHTPLDLVAWLCLTRRTYVVCVACCHRVAAAAAGLVLGWCGRMNSWKWAALRLLLRQPK